MKDLSKTAKTALAAFIAAGLGIGSLWAQEAPEAEKEESGGIAFDAGLDIYSSYIFRGAKFGTGPAFQPWVEMTAGGLAIGAWGSVNSGGGEEGEAAEMDLYISYEFPFGLSLGVTDYYYPGNDFFNVSDTAGAHGLEINLNYEIKGLSLSANYIPLEAPGAGTVGGDMYFELGYAFSKFSIFAGAGNGWHTTDTEFKLVNVGLSTEKEIQITDKFSLPLSGAVILNPDQKQFYITVGISL
jgi:predicted porin